MKSPGRDLSLDPGRQVATPFPVGQPRSLLRGLRGPETGAVVTEAVEASGLRATGIYHLQLLQRAAGNRAVRRLIDAAPPGPPAPDRTAVAAGAPAADRTAVAPGAPAVDRVAPPVAETAASGLRGASQSLPHLDSIQRAFGRFDVRGVRAHLGAEARTASEALGAEAYATGSAVAFSSAPSLHTAAHEAAHVIQQRAGVHLKGGVGEAGDLYERHADAVADRVVRGASAEALLEQRTASGVGPAPQGPTLPSAVQLLRKPKQNTSWTCSDDGNILLKEPKELYATDALIEDANNKLGKSGSQGSFITLGKADECEFEGRSLKKVVPGWVPRKNMGDQQRPYDIDKQGARDSNQMNLEDSGGKIALYADCGRASGAVTGSRRPDNKDRRAVYRTGNKESLAKGMQEKGMDARSKNRAGELENHIFYVGMQQFLSKKENLSHFKKDVHIQGGSKGKVKVRKVRSGLEAQYLYSKLDAQGKDAFDMQLGINHYADPAIGEAYVTATSFNMPEYEDDEDFGIWNFHWAGVILKDGSDNVTLENFGVDKKLDAEKKDALPQINRRWLFKIYTTRTSSKGDLYSTFHGASLLGSEHGEVATTLRVRTFK